MIRKIGVIYQDANSLGFLQGLKDRLGCNAELISYPAQIGTVRVMPRRQLKDAWRYFHNKEGVDLVLRLTDADGHSWQEVQRKELARIPEGTRESWVFAVAVECIEDWIALDQPYLAKALGIDPTSLRPGGDRVDIVKNAIKRSRPPNEPTPDAVARIVRDAPPVVMKRWLKDDAFQEFYSECRAAAKRADCSTNNDLEDDGA